MRIDPLANFEDPPRDEPVHLRKPAPRRVLNFSPRRAVAAGIVLKARVTLISGESPYSERGTVVGFSTDGRQAYVRWDDDVANHIWHYLHELEAI